MFLRLLNEVDAHVFTGDTLIDYEARAALLKYCARWLAEVPEWEARDVARQVEDAE